MPDVSAAMSLFFAITDPKQIEEIESLSLDLIDELYEGYHSELANVSINVKASIGIAFYPEHGDDSNKVVAAADEAMYFVKKKTVRQTTTSISPKIPRWKIFSTHCNKSDQKYSYPLFRRV